MSARLPLPAPAEAARPAGSAMGVMERLLFAMLPLGLLVAVIALGAAGHVPWSFSRSWVPSLGIDLAWRVDGLSYLMLLMIAGVGTAVFVYAGGYLAGHPQQRRLFVLLSLFTVAMVGCVTADNLVLLFVFWELTSITSFMLVGFNHTDPASRRSAQQALMVTGSGGLVLLAGVLLLAEVMGTTSLSTIVTALPGTPRSLALDTAMALLLVGAFTKSAQFPFHFWLPNAMSAPTPVSAFLHSATMVKLGVYLLARFDPGFGSHPGWQASLTVVGSVTAAWGMLLALRERDLKRILAWSTVATLGTLVMLIGLDSDSAAIAVGALLLAHALYKAPLFFVAGNIDHGTGTRLIDRLGGLRSQMPWTAAAALLAGVSMAGLPASFGFVVKDVIAAAKSASEGGALVLLAQGANTVFGAIAVAVAGVAAVRVFWRHPGVNERCEAHEGGLALVLPPLALAGAGMALGLFPFLAEALVATASQSMTATEQALVVQLTPALLPTLASMLLTLLVGVAVYAGWDPLHRGFERITRPLQSFGAVALYERSLAALPRLAAGCTRVLQHGSLPGYAAMAIGACTGSLAGVLFAAAPGDGWSLGPREPLPGLGAMGAAALIVAGAVGALLSTQRMLLLLTSGMVGYGTAVMFLFTGAPDLAFTQFAVETVFVIVVACVLLALAREGRSLALDEPRWRLGHAALAAGFATVLTGLLLAVAATPLDDTLSRAFSEMSVPLANGRNVVNVILVDFRALDTLGEISVVLLSLLAAVPLLQGLYAAATRRGQEAP